MMAPTRSSPRLLASLLIAVLLAPACAAGGPSGDLAPAHTVTLNRSDAGEMTSLRVGDHLVLDLGTVPNGSWQLTEFPEDALSLVSSETDLGRFEFRARAVGGGQIQAVSTPGCGPAAAPACASPGDQGPADAVGGAFPPRPFSVRVTVS
jgi:hypothetical protein